MWRGRISNDHYSFLKSFGDFKSIKVFFFINTVNINISHVGDIIYIHSFNLGYEMIQPEVFYFSYESLGM